MDPAVDWPKAWEGGRVRGSHAVRDYRTRQFGAIDSRVAPLGFTERDDGRIAVDVHQVVRSPDGDLVSDTRVTHVYSLRHGLVMRLDVEGGPPA